MTCCSHVLIGTGDNILRSTSLRSMIDAPLPVIEASDCAVLNSELEVNLNQAPVLTYVSISSNNVFDSAFAKAGDEITIEFASDEPFASVPTIQIAGINALVQQRFSVITWMATIVVPDLQTLDLTQLPEGLVSFTINYQNTNGIAVTPVTSTTDASTVSIRRISPVVKAQNVMVDLNRSGTASITTDQVNNASVDSAGLPLDNFSLDRDQFSCDDVTVGNSFSARFNGVPVDVNVSNLPEGNESRTIMFWVKPDALNIWTSFIDHGSLGNGNDAFFNMGGINNGIYLSASSKNIFYELPATSDPWLHISATHNEVNNNTVLYVNGKRVAEMVGAINTLAASHFTIGNDFGLINPFFGNVSEVRIYDSVLSDLEISDSYFTSLQSLDTGLLSYYTFKEGKFDAQDAVSGSSFAIGSNNSAWSIDNPPYLNGKKVVLTGTDLVGLQATGDALVTIRSNDLYTISCPNSRLIITPDTSGVLVNYNTPTFNNVCLNNNLPMNSDAFISIPQGTSLLGVYEGHTYFVSDNASLPDQIYNDYVSSSYNLLTINDLAENNFIAQALTDAGISNALMGLNDFQSQGEYAWWTLTPVAYTNWINAGPNSSNGEHYVSIADDGLWSNTTNTTAVKYIIEVPRAITQTAGLQSGDVFPVGSTQNSFEYSFEDGSTLECVFVVNIQLDTFQVKTQNITVSLDANGEGSITPAEVNDDSLDTQGNLISNFTLDRTFFNCDDIQRSDKKHSLNVQGFKVDFDQSGLPNNSESRTVMFWTKPAVQSGNTFLFRYGSDPDISHFDVLLFGDNIILRSGNFARDLIYSQGNPRDEWIHVTAVHNSVSQLTKLFINGSFVGQTLGALPDLDISSFSLGSRASPPFFQAASAKYSELRLYDKALTAREIESSYYKSIDGTTPNLIAYYPLDLGFGERLYSGLDRSMFVSMTQTWSADAPDFFGAIPVTLTATDNLGNNATGQGLIRVVNELNPTVHMPDDIIEYVQDPTGTTVNYDVPTIEENCSNSGIPQNYTDYINVPLGTSFLTSYQGHSYYVSDNPVIPADAFNLNLMEGHYLWKVDDPDENNYVAQALRDAGVPSALIGLRNIEEQIELIWQDRTRLTPNNLQFLTPLGGIVPSINIDYFSIDTQDNQWYQAIDTQSLKYIIEVPYAVAQTSGLPSGSRFPVGKTTNTFEFFLANDFQTTQSFDVIIKEAAYIYENGNWSPNDPSSIINPSGSQDQVVVKENTSSTDNLTLKNLTVFEDVTFSLNPTSVLEIFGDFLVEGSLNANNATVRANGQDLSSTWDSQSSTFGTFELVNAQLSLNGDYTIIDKIYNEDASSNSTLNVSGANVILQSTATQTAVIDGSRLDIIGEVTVEQYFKERRAYNFISSPVTTSTTIYDNWQEGGNAPLGYGTHITGAGGSTNGFDPSISNNYSMYGWDNIDQVHTVFTSTNSPLDILTAGQYSRILIRGDRTIDLNSNASSGSTTLRTKGQLLNGDYILPFIAPNNGEYIIVGNPYQTNINMGDIFNNAISANLSTSNINAVEADFYYVWDPTVSSQGAYRAYSTATGTMIGGDSPGSTFNVSGVLGPGQAAFFVASGRSSSAFILSRPRNDSPFTSSSVLPPQFGNINLKLYEHNQFIQQTGSLDQLYIRFEEGANNDIDHKDALKFNNIDENISRSHASLKKVMFETRNTPVQGEVLPLHIDQYVHDQYVLEFQPVGFIGKRVLLKDHFTNLLVPVSNDRKTIYNFEIDINDPGSTAFDRFDLRFENETLSSQDLNNLKEIKLYPNPVTKGILNIDLSDFFGTKEITMTNTLGQKIKQMHTNKMGVTAIDVSDMSSGMYLVTIALNDSSRTIKVVIE